MLVLPILCFSVGAQKNMAAKFEGRANIGTDLLCFAVGRQRVHKCSADYCNGCGEGDWSGSTVGNCCRLFCTGIRLLITLNPGWLGIQSRVVLQAHLSSMRLRSEVSAEPLRVGLGTDWKSAHMATASCNGKNHSSALPLYCRRVTR